MKKIIDCHIHTEFSPDGIEKPEDIIKAAIEMKLEHIAITDHMDIGHSNGELAGVTDLVSYKEKLMPLREKYSSEIYVAIGIECGYIEESENLNKQALEKADLEYVINSIHEVDGSDCYYQEHFFGKTKEEVYNNYFNAVLKSLNAPYPFHAVGHLGYIARTAPYENKKLYYKDFPCILDAILEKLIEKEIILELNTNVYSSGAASQPGLDIVKRYKEKGGKYINFSSDAHRISNLCRNYDSAFAIAESCGFKEFTVIQNRKKKMISIY